MFRLIVKQFRQLHVPCFAAFMQPNPCQERTYRCARIAEMLYRNVPDRLGSNCCVVDEYGVGENFCNGFLGPVKTPVFYLSRWQASTTVICEPTMPVECKSKIVGL